MTRSTRALLSSVLLTSGLVIGLLSAGALTATSADAASCGGTLIGRKAITYSGSTIGELAVYYNSSTGRNCSQTNHLGATYGVSTLTEATIVRCTQKTKQDQFCTEVGSTYQIDKGNYAYLAGPVSVSSPNNCVKATGVIDWKGAWRTTQWVGGC